jgi:hypothetical protein
MAWGRLRRDTCVSVARVRMHRSGWHESTGMSHINQVISGTDLSGWPRSGMGRESCNTGGNREMLLQVIIP